MTSGPWRHLHGAGPNYGEVAGENSKIQSWNVFTTTFISPPKEIPSHRRGTSAGSPSRPSHATDIRYGGKCDPFKCLPACGRRSVQKAEPTFKFGMANCGVVALGVLVTLLVLIARSASQFPIPPRYDGFEFRPNTSFNEVLVEAFFDPLCPDSRDSWPPLKQALYHYKDKVGLIVHPFPLPYHHNAFLASRSLHIANRWNASSTYSLLELFFKFQEKFYNNETLNVTMASVIEKIINFASTNLGNSSVSVFESGFQDIATETATRISFKYGCSRAVTGTPYFFVNGIPLNSDDESLSYEKWQSIINPLLVGHTNT